MRLGGTSEIAAELGVSRQRVLQLREQPGFPAPVGEIAAGQIWDLDAVAAWSQSGLRRSSGRPTTRRRRLLAKRYVLDLDPIGQGGFADVYRATDIKVHRDGPYSVVAVKVLREVHDEEVRRRFQRELRLIAECSHPHIVPILDHGEDEDGRLWYVMPLAKGSLADDIHLFAGNDARILRVMRQICDGVAYIHGRGIFHRDLKPANVLRIGSDTWAVSDFGLAREADRTTTALTSTLGGMGTFFYAAPELFAAAKDATAEADIFGLGKLLQELMTGEVPAQEPPEGRFRPVIAKATRQQPAQRYRTIQEMLAALEQAASVPAQWRTLEDAARRLTDQLRNEVPDEAALAELVDLVLGDNSEQEAIAELRYGIPLMSRDAIARLWEKDQGALREILERYGDFAANRQWEFDFCDVIADFFDRCVLVTSDEQVLQVALRTLIILGHQHNRWHVRDVAIGILQRLREPDFALAACEALRESPPDAVEWTLSDFVVRSLHPTIREVAEQVRLRASNSNESSDAVS